MSEASATRRCRFCATPLAAVLVDLGVSPLCESFLRPEQLAEPEVFYPLRAEVCGSCFLVQLPSYVSPAEIFSEYAYFSSFSSTWLDHARQFVGAMVERLGLGPASLVVEVGSNDGYLLRNVVERGIPALGIEPAANVAAVAVERGVPTLVRFFGRALAEELVAGGRRADLIVVNNTLAQMPDLNDAMAGLAILLGPDGTVSIEVPHLLRLLEGVQFDTIYHEHFSYFSLTTLARIAAAHGLAVVDVEELATHGGSLRVLLGRVDSATPAGASPAVARVLADEAAAGLTTLAGYAAFADRVDALKRDLVDYLIDARRRGRRVVGYGAPGKANTLLNYAGIRADLLPFLVDRNPYKHGRFTPGTHIPIHEPERLWAARPDDVLILPWNLRDEITADLAGIRAWGGRFVVAIPSLEIIE